MLKIFSKGKKDKTATVPPARTPPQRMTAPSATKQDELDPATESLLRAIAEKKAEDPLIGLKIGAKELNTRIISALQNERGVHVETLLTILGSLGGYACQASIREGLIRTGKMTEEEAFTITMDAGNNKFYISDLLNRPLAESQYSIWSLTGGAAQSLGCTALPDIHEIFRRVVESIGTENFGIPNVPNNHRATEPPINYVINIWPKTLPIIKMFCESPREWPTLHAFAIYNAIQMSKGVIDPAMAARIVMEAAIPMSKINIERLNAL